MRYKLVQGNNFAWLRSLPDNCIDSLVTDPPYGLGKEPDMVECLRDWLLYDVHEVSGKGFMGKAWDAFVPQPIFWKEVYRVLKPGGYVVSFGGTRTYDLMVLAVRLAGFNIVDMCEWVYGSGFPKSHNVSKAIDKAAGAERGERLAPKAGHEKHVGKDNMRSLRESGTLSAEGGFSRPWMHDPQKVEDAHWNFAPATDSAKEWDGFGSALKPAHEPILLARKPLEKGLTIAQNVQKWGTGALNIGGVRIGTDTVKTMGGDKFPSIYGAFKTCQESTHLGRWPSNLLLANVPDVIGLFPETGGGMAKHNSQVNRTAISPNSMNPMQPNGKNSMANIGDSGSASRYFFRADLLPIERDDYEALPLHLKVIYCSKPSKAERSMGVAGVYKFRQDGSLDGNQTAERNNFHPTVKAVSLMLHLVTLVTPPNGVCCDPFMGSGTTGIATMLAGPQMQFWGCELTAEYLPISEQRIKNWKLYQTFIKNNKSREIPFNIVQGTPMGLF